jgi:hypothetical protein
MGSDREIKKQPSDRHMILSLMTVPCWRNSYVDLSSSQGGVLKMVAKSEGRLSLTTEMSVDMHTA